MSRRRAAHDRAIYARTSTERTGSTTTCPQGDTMKRTLAFVTLALLIAVGPIALAAEQPEQYVAISNFNGWFASPPSEFPACERHVSVLLQTFRRLQIGPGDSMVQGEDVGVYQVTWKKDPKTTHMIIFKCVPILPIHDSEASGAK
jgi:hypothetical protein